MTFPNPNAIKRPAYLPPITTREEREQWDIDVQTRYRMLTEDLTVNGKVKTSAYNKALGGCNQKSIPDTEWENIVDHCLWVSVYTYDRNKRENIEKYNLTAEKKLRVPKTVCPLPNYFWKLIYFTSCTWYKQNQHRINQVSYEDRFMAEK